MELVLILLFKSDVFITSALAPAGTLAVASANPNSATEKQRIKDGSLRLSSLLFRCCVFFYTKVSFLLCF